ncbi:TIGR02611 family protein [Saccharopolyspora indica]|uniref:TIGR02611 family protein n=1 Tax=Saccharopolyspora indica TaxID=1229659 RepID=UPI0022EA7946|nr:TIGR02611 family protein [Saccharopolyspora indica]MDA3646841.1 TIGR02611 family protein [Saccharopolyspora indica]
MRETCPGERADRILAGPGAFARAEAPSEDDARPTGGALTEEAEPGSRRAAADPATDDYKPRLRERLWMFRERLRAKAGMNLAYRVVIGVIGGAVLAAGILMIPYPGPGWLVVFAGLGILATEFHWAGRVNGFAKRHYRRWVDWLGRQHLATKLAVMGGTCLIVLVTMWMLGLFGTVGGWLGLRWSWLASPLFGP